MGKKGSNLSILYLIGMAVAAVGFFCPMFKLGPLTMTGVKFINFDNFGFVTIGALLIVAGAILGAVWALLPMIGIKLPAVDTVKLVALIAVLAGVIVLVVGCLDNKLYSAIGKQFFKHAIYGTYMVICGWVVAAVGKFL